MNSAASNLIDALKRPAIWPDCPDHVDCVETHISWVLLTRDFAWKIKKPVAFDFLDFSTLDARKHFCEEELRLNRRTAPDLYLDLVPICGDAAHPIIDGSGEPFEFAVKMRRFEESRLLSNMAAENHISPALVDALAESVAEFHSSLPSAGLDSEYGRPEDIRRDALDNFNTIEQLSGGNKEQTDAIGHLRTWTVRESDRLANTFEQRRQSGFIRECHGDLHLRNIVQRDSGPCLFDCVEFNDRFRWIDVMSEIAFLIMDLEEHGLEHFARRFLNRYLEQTGDYAGLNVLRFYLVYRAMVRAKVDMIQLQDRSRDISQRRLLRREFSEYLSVADHDAPRERPALIIMHGLSGSGKTVFSQQIIEQTTAIRVRSDVERKRIHGVSETDRVTGEAQKQLYSSGASHRTYERLSDLARTVITSGFPVIVDATFLGPGQRGRFRSLAGELNVPFRIVSCTAPEEVLLARVAAREARDQDASDAGIAVLRRQLQMETDMDSERPSEIITVNTSDEHTSESALQTIREMLAGV